ncbi:CinA family nicotinamide mononucleotide deamidase-related protein [Flavobacterium jejuense]|uniref:CinA-like protein n=1 Tax=Flavobacterium jejuense TaxID=1544455 RepID=A0ABX0IRL0_9FLAO|nr:CinA family nicotinamide mononucleotide deamidase-related protein [Flavobacterium jejuense]NHN25123.1 CinA family nicotinamide mononucleotide deamidase-related protein [Flavobacterium jejuense]
MKAAIVTIGDEILIGQIIDTNSSYIAKALDKIGIATHEMISISDDKQHILNTLFYFQNKVDVVIMTGGLGPTKDDITKKTFCDYFEDELVENTSVLEHVRDLIESFYRRPISQINKEQALVPSKAKILFNKMGTAPGMWMEKENTVFVSLPGVPYEMKYLVDHEVVPQLIQRFKRPYIVHKTIMTYGRGESLIAEQIEDWEDNLPKYIKLAYLPAPGRVRLRLTARGENEKDLLEALEIQIKELYRLIGEIIIGIDEDESIEIVVGKLLKEREVTLSLAESCTGGKMAEVITSISGASSYFKGSIVSYATEAKIKILGVDESLITNFSVVSEEVAKNMALQSQKLFHTDYAIATTGNAGPNKGDSDAKTGTVYIALATPKEVYCEQFNFGQPREKVIGRAVNKAFELLYKEILKN